MQMHGAILKDGTVGLQKLKTGGITAGAVMFAAAANALAEDPGNFDYDPVAHKLSLGMGVDLGGGARGPVFAIKGDVANVPTLPFAAAIYAPQFSGQYDPVLKMGFNVASPSTRVDNARGQLVDSWEGRYLGTQERHWEGLLANGSPKRWVTLQSNEDTGYSQYSILDVDSINIYGTDVSDGGGSGGGVNIYGAISRPLYFKEIGGPQAYATKPNIAAQLGGRVFSFSVGDPTLEPLLSKVDMTLDTRAGADHAMFNLILRGIGESAPSTNTLSVGKRGIMGRAGAVASGTGNQTQNTGCGIVRIAAGQSQVTVTNNLCVAARNPRVFSQVQNAGGSSQVARTDVNDGSFVIMLTGNAASECVVAWDLQYVHQ